MWSIAVSRGLGVSSLISRWCLEPLSRSAHPEDKEWVRFLITLIHRLNVKTVSEFEGTRPTFELHTNIPSPLLLSIKSCRVFGLNVCETDTHFVLRALSFSTLYLKSNNRYCIKVWALIPMGWTEMSGRGSVWLLNFNEETYALAL